MLLDYAISKPAHLRGYRLHRMVTELVGEHKALFSDEGATLLIRTEARINAQGTEVKLLAQGQLTAFELRACVSKKKQGKHIYMPLGDWRARHAWLKQKATENGFEVLTLYSSSKMVKIADSSRAFKVDQTDFTGILKVNNTELFKSALANGVGSTAKTFGFGMLVI